jgi:catechol 2,3-dioxygenase-like lactoylglutathione lyase family enzyme
LPRPGFIDHVGIGVPDLVAAKEYYDALMSVLGLCEWFETGPGGPLNYGPNGAQGSQLFFYQAEEPGTYSRMQPGLHHLAFLVASRAIVREAHQWARTRDAIILDEPQEFPQYGPHCFATSGLIPMESSWRPSAMLLRRPSGRMQASFPHTRAVERAVSEPDSLATGLR